MLIFTSIVAFAIIILLLVFMLLIALPLYFHADRSGYPLPWLEPSGVEQEAVRTQLHTAIGDKPPGGVVLVSFDYTPAQEGEIIGRF